MQKEIVPSVYNQIFRMFLHKYIHKKKERTLRGAFFLLYNEKKAGIEQTDMLL